MMSLLTFFVTRITVFFTRVMTAVQVNWNGCDPEPVQRIYYANHASHGDFLLIWTVLPPVLQKNTRPIAGADYWMGGRLRKFLALKVFDAVLVNRRLTQGADNPIAVMSEAIDKGASLILFPEGTRNTTDTDLLPFKSGIYHLVQQNPEVELVPVWLANLKRVLPKGEFVPVPLQCSVTFGAPLKLQAEETKTQFLARTRDAMLNLAPKELVAGEL